MDDSSHLNTMLIAVAVLIAMVRLLNNLLRAGYFGLGRISLLAFIEKTRTEKPGLWAFLEDPAKLNYSAQTLDKLSLVLLLAICWPLFPEPGLTHLGFLFAYLVIFDLLLPNTVAAYVPEFLVARLFPILRSAYLLVYPLIFIMILIANRKREEEDEEEDAPEDIKAFIQAGAEEGIIEDHEASLIQNLLHFDETVVREIMTPRTDMQCVSLDMSHDEILEIFHKTKFSRLPVYRGDIDHIEGMLRFKDFFELLEAHEPIEDHLKEIMLVPENKNVGELLQEMLKRRTQMVIVIDEFGGTMGLTTLEDMIEEIIGEIHDEHEEPELDEIVDMGGGVYLVDGKVLIEDFRDMFDVTLDNGNVDTIGGYLFNREGRIPAEGEQFQLDTLDAEIATADDRRIYKIKVTVPQKENVAESDD